MKRNASAVTSLVLVTIVALSVTPEARAQIVTGTTTIVEPLGTYTVDVEFSVFDALDASNPNPLTGQLTYAYSLDLPSSSSIRLNGFAVEVLLANVPG